MSHSCAARGQMRDVSQPTHYGGGEGDVAMGGGECEAPRTMGGQAGNLSTKRRVQGPLKLLRSCPVALCFLLAFIPTVEPGFCRRPAEADLSFCRSVTYKVYVMDENPAPEYWRALDRKAEIMQDDWNKQHDCGVENAPDGWCQNYACALTFPRCNAFDDAPLGVCRQTCIDCFSTCTPDRPILAPAMFFTSAGDTWADAYTNTYYDTYLRSYRCHADHRLVDGVTVGLLFYGDECTSGAGRLTAFTGVWAWLSGILTCFVIVALYST